MALAINIFAQISSIPMLNGLNFKVWKDTVEIVLGGMDLDIALREEKPTSTPENLNEDVEKFFTKNEKAEASSLLSKLVSMRYKGKENIREYIMKMSHLVSKLKALTLELSEDLLVHFILISLPAHFGQFKMLQQDKIESAHMASSSQYKRKHDTTPDVHSQQKKAKKQDQVSTYFFCKKVGHMKKDCVTP
ncbi:hypothetical protein AAHE18_U099200 [Arachis hypogaea]